MVERRGPVVGDGAAVAIEHDTIGCWLCGLCFLGRLRTGEPLWLLCGGGACAAAPNGCAGVAVLGSARFP